MVKKHSIIGRDKEHSKRRWQDRTPSYKKA